MTSIRMSQIRGSSRNVHHPMHRYREIRVILDAEYILTHMHAHTRVVFTGVVPYREVWSVDVDRVARGLNGPRCREAGNRPLLPRFNLFNLPNPLHADSARRRESNPLSAALDDSNSCVTSPQSAITCFPRGKIRIYLFCNSNAIFELGELACTEEHSLDTFILILELSRFVK